MSDVIGMDKIPYKTRRALIIGVIVLAYSAGWYVGGRFQEHNIAKKQIVAAKKEVVNQISKDINLILDSYKQGI